MITEQAISGTGHTYQVVCKNGAFYVIQMIDDEIVSEKKFTNSRVAHTHYLRLYTNHLLDYLEGCES